VRKRALAISSQILLGVLAAGSVPAQESPRSLAIASYDIEARLDVVSYTITAKQILTWRNAGGDAAPDLYFHLYLNAFANNRSTFMREAAEPGRKWQESKPDGWGYQHVTRLVVEGDDRTNAIEYVHPDDDNVDDRTVIRVPLLRPIGSGERARIEIHFVAKLPKIMARSGYAGPFALVAQWFPKIGVYEDGAWNCHQYHVASEFYSDFGSYDVRLTVPSESVVGATGALAAELDNGDGSKTVRYHAENVHDFAWTLDPRFVEVTDRFEDTQLRLLLQPRHLSQATRHLDAVKAAMRAYRDWYGPYPYPQLTIVDPGPGGRGAGGMEYPMLITVGTTWWMPASLRLPEVIAVHEFGHQYWYGMVANNEFEEAWLDEGINSYVEGLIMEDAYGPEGSYADLLGIKVGSLALNRLNYLAVAQQDPITRSAWRFLDRQSYVGISYGKTSLVLATLERYLGGQRMRAALRYYFERWRFRHPRGKDFIAAVNQVAEEDLGWFFDQTLATGDVLDYAVGRVRTEEVPGFAGTQVPPTPASAATLATEKRYRNEVVIERRGTVQMPVEVAIGFADGSETAEWWDGRDRWRRFESMGTQPVEYAIVDPNGKLPLDVDLLNNSRMRSSGTRGVIRLAGRWGFWFQNLMHFLTGL
jgi:hypothetical protein